MKENNFALKLNNVSYQFPETDILVLDNISFDLKNKTIAALLGPNGAGKSTLIKAILGLIQPVGNIEIFGNPLFTQIDKIGYVPQRYSFNTAIPITIYEFLSLALLKVKLNQKEINNKIDLALDQVNLSKYKYSLLSTLSGGQLQRILVARSLIHSPKLLLLDEPEAGIDVGAENSLFQLLVNLRDNFDMTIIIASHELDVVYGFADEVICINKKLICSGKPKTVMTDKTFKSLYGEDIKFYNHAHNH